MSIDFDGHHSGGSSFVYVSVIKKKKIGKESQYMVSHLELGSDPSIGSDRESGHENISHFFGFYVRECKRVRKRIQAFFQ